MKENLSTSQKISPGKYFFGGDFFPGGFFWTFFSFGLFVVALVKRLSVRETQNVIKNVLRGRASKFPPLTDFFYCVFGRFSIKGGPKNATEKITTSHARLSQFKAE
jgi:hypothetical protein